MRFEELRGKRVYLDSIALIYATETDANTQPGSVRALLKAVSTGELRAFASHIVRAEVMAMPLRDTNQRLIAIYQTMLAQPGPIAVVGLNSVITDLSAALRAQHRGLKLADALHLASAFYAGCHAFISGDRQIKSLAPHPMVVLSFEDIAV